MKTMKRLVTALLLICMIMMSGCNEREKILGKWSADESVIGGIKAGTEYTFTENGTGKKRTVVGVEVDMTYWFDEENGTLTITTSTLGIKNENTYKYRFEKDAVYLTNESEELRLVRIEEATESGDVSEEG